MAGPEINWVEVPNPFARPVAAAGAGPQIAGMAPQAAGAGPTLPVPDLTIEFATPILKAEFLLNAAAKVEHALLVQYLYAAYSLRSRPDDGLNAGQQTAVQKWLSELRKIAKEEMAHLMTVQNLLIFTKLKPHFGREPLSSQASLFPFPMHLEGMTRRSLAQYVIAEAPDHPTDIDDIYAEAKAAIGGSINRVGVLYLLLGLVFTKEDELYSNAAGGDPWHVMVRDLGHSVYSKWPQHPRSAWHLPDDAFDLSSLARQATDDEWGPGANLRVFPVQTRAECLFALRDIGIQGEGVEVAGPGAEISHYERFKTVYRGDGTIPPFPAPTDWTPAHAVPRDPVLSGPASPSLIDQPDAVRWASLADDRYALLLMVLEFHFTAEGEHRGGVVKWCLGAMAHLAALSTTLTVLSQTAAGTGKAALPFTMPPETQFPSAPVEFRNYVIARLEAAVARTGALLLVYPGNGDLEDMITADRALIDKLKRPPTPSTAEAAFRELLEARRATAQFVHTGIQAGDTDLGQLFRDRRYDDIIAFLLTGTSVFSENNKPLVVRGKPEESALMEQLTAGVMEGHLSTAQVEVIGNWIASLTPDAPPPPPVVNPEEEFIELLKAKQPVARFRHGSVDVGGGVKLKTLFANQDYPAIIQFLKTGTSAIDPATGKPLVVPGKPAESGLYIQITDPDGVMAGIFAPEEAAVVERWILSLPPPAGDGPQMAGFGFADTPQADGPKALALTPVVAALANPIFVSSPPGDQQRLFIVEQGGRIRIFDRATGQLLATPFLTVANISTGGERGLLGLAFHPQYATNGRFFVNCTNGQGHTEIRRYQVSAQNPNQADSASTLVLRVDQPFPNHNGGCLQFSPRDGLLYIGLGDGGFANDPDNRAQNMNELLGKMLRIDVDRDDFPGDADRNYGIPPSNPFRGQAGAREEIWALGLRNPWRWSFDRQTSDLWIGDVGQNKREEIDFQPASSTGGENYGWRIKEGTLATGMGSPAGLTLVEPVHEYGHNVGMAIVGGYVYRGARFPALQGRYFFAEFTGKIWSFLPQSGVLADLKEHTAELAPPGGELGPISSFGEDAAGELYVVSLDGVISRLQLVPVAAPAAAVAAAADGVSRWDQVTSIRIHPAIGVARVGNSGFTVGQPATPADPADFFIGPEKPHETAPPSGGYKRNGKIRRQAARFRLYGYDAQNQLIGEITAADAEITWSVELANMKASWREFDGLTPASPLRNPQFSGVDRKKLELTPGFRSITGPNQAAAFGNASFTDVKNGQSRTVSNIYLGGIQSDVDGRLLVLGGEGTAQSPWSKPLGDFANNDGWFDTTADGPVTATVRFKDTTHTAPVRGAWVVCGPPKFAPALRNIITLYDTLVQTAVTAGRLPQPGQPSFQNDIYPMLQRAMLVRWVMESPDGFHDHFAAAVPPAALADRRQIVRRLRNPRKGQGLNTIRMNMPRLFDDANQWVPAGDPGLAVTPLMYDALQRWANDDFVNDWTGGPSQPPANITPDGLDQAALENCAGAAFFPGIEASWMLRDVYPFFADEAFRLNPSTLHAGDVTKQMALPWQADFFDCTGTSNGIGWWPQQRPDEVKVAGQAGPQSWTRDKVDSHKDMVAHWHELGFVVESNGEFVESERS